MFGDAIGAGEAAAMLGEVGDVGERVAPELRDIGREIAAGKSLVPLAGYLRELAFLARTAGTIRTAIGAIRRIVGALKRYSRLDEAPLERVDVHAGIEDTLIILSHQLKYGENGVNVKRSFGALPPIFAYVGELNQVWTNLIHNAIQAMDGRGEIVIETTVVDSQVQVAIQDSGPGIAADVAAAHLRAVLHHQGQGGGDRPRAVDLGAHRREARRHDPRRQPPGPHALRGPACRSRVPAPSLRRCSIPGGTRN